MKHKLIKRMDVLRLFAIAFIALLAALGGSIMQSANGAPIATAESPKLIAHFTTYYGESSENRKYNVELAARKIAGTVLYPEDEFSFNDTVGKRTEANGFKNALIISDGEFVDGIGGGVCQVSSTVYNCALLAGLTISHVRPHSLPVSYVAPSFDAMVSSETDFRFVNTLSGAVTLKVKTDGKDIRAEVYGFDEITVRRRSETIEVLPFETEYRDDDTLALGTEVIDSYGKNGLKSEGYLDFFKDGKLINSLLIRRDTYLPQKRVILRGTNPELMELPLQEQ
ncbi:MAG: VanW family protein [Clostridia bacterium]|nr:VanW family protein [Clostridia bacterium]